MIQIELKEPYKYQNVLSSSSPGSTEFTKATVRLRDLAYAGDKSAEEVLKKFDLSIPPEILQQKKYILLSEKTSATGYEKTKQIATAAFASGEKPEMIKDMLIKNDPDYQKLQSSMPTVNERMLFQAEVRSAIPSTNERSNEQAVQQTTDLGMTI